MKTRLFSLFCLLMTSYVFADINEKFDQSGFVTTQHALSCVKLNKDINLASNQMLASESNKNNLKSKINYLHNEIQKRRQLIEGLDQQHNQSNNNNYNSLVSQFEDMIEERKHTISQYNNKNQLLNTQHKSVIRLEQRFSEQCLVNFKISEKVHKEVCGSESIRWCHL